MQGLVWITMMAFCLANLTVGWFTKEMDFYTHAVIWLVGSFIVLAQKD